MFLFDVQKKLSNLTLKNGETPNWVVDFLLEKECFHFSIFSCDLFFSLIIFCRFFLHFSFFCIFSFFHFFHFLFSIFFIFSFFPLFCFLVF